MKFYAIGRWVLTNKLMIITTFGCSTEEQAEKEGRASAEKYGDFKFVEVRSGNYNDIKKGLA